jgi:hypothetical protein
MRIRQKECISTFWLDQSSLFYNPMNRYEAVNSSSPYVTMVMASACIYATSLNQNNGSG